MAAEHKTYELVVQPRENTGKVAKKMGRQEMVPGVVYGHSLDSESVQVSQRELERVYLRAGSTGLVDLKVGESASPRKVFIHKVQRDPVTHTLRHVDFMVINLREEMTVSVAVVLVGEAPAVERKEGLLLHGLDHVQVRALPADLPPVLEADVSGLEAVDDAIHVSDLSIPDNVTLLTAGEEMVAKITNLPVEEVEEVEEAPEEAEAAEGEEAAGGGGEQGESSDEG
ncbi:MAG TPA: 50S ribosomal protein L25 [Chloroflexia bacterium]|nr:50S ribosomal protein L25 [Chloroflexia bacterium]